MLLAGEINLLKIWRKRINIISGNKIGGLRASKTNKERYGEKYYSEIGKKGGMRGHTGGFAANRALARLAGAKGGRVSSRSSGVRGILESHEAEIQKMFKNGESVHAVAIEFGVSDGAMKRFALEAGILSDEYTPIVNYREKR